RESVDTQRQVRAGIALVPRALPTGVLGPFSVAADLDVLRTATVYGDRREAAIGSEQWWMHGAFGTRLGLHWNTVGAAKPAVGGGLTVKLPHSIYAEGHVTKDGAGQESNWGIGGRVTF